MPEITLEIGHVLFVDIVGYSKLLIHEQLERLEKLREIARATETFRSAQREGKLMRLPTGDGGALVFRTSPEEPAKCAVEIARELKKHPELEVRMGIHSGPVKEVTDLSEQGNIAGAGINIAQRVMDCGDAGHILVSKRVADDLEQYARWRPLLHDLGSCEVKHGVSLALFNLHSDEFGNPECPKRFDRDEKVERKIDSSTITGPRFSGAAPEEIDRRVAVRKSKRRESERVLCRRYPGRNPYPSIAYRRSESDFTDVDSTLQEHDRTNGRNRKATRRREYSGRLRSAKPAIRCGFMSS